MARDGRLRGCSPDLVENLVENLVELRENVSHAGNQSRLRRITPSLGQATRPPDSDRQGSRLGSRQGCRMTCPTRNAADHEPALRRSRAAGLFPSGFFLVLAIVLAIVLDSQSLDVAVGCRHCDRSVLSRRGHGALDIRTFEARLRVRLPLRCCLVGSPSLLRRDRLRVRSRKPTCPIIFCPGTCLLRGSRHFHIVTPC